VRRPTGAAASLQKEILNMSTEMSRRCFTAMSLMPAVRGVFGAPTDPAMVFPFGTHIYREPHLPLEQLHADLPLLKRLGFSMVKIQESWSADEKKEGEIDLSTVERVISDAKVFIDGKCMYKYEDFEGDKALDRIKQQLKDKEYELLQLM
jgi:hypothetical protein